MNTSNNTTEETYTTKDQQIAQVEEQNREIESLFKASIAREENNRKKSESQTQYIVRLEAQVSTLQLHTRNFLDRFEAIWDRVYGHQSDLPEDVISIEEIIQYCESAKYMAVHFGRKFNYRRDVEEKIKGIRL